MEKAGRDNSIKESGIALVTILVMVVVIMTLIGGLTYLFLKTTGANIINRQFSTVYEASKGGVEYMAGIINAYINDGQLPGNIGGVKSGNLEKLKMIINCSLQIEGEGGEETITMKTADGKYTITTEIRCLGTSPIPGQGGVLRFPPPPPLSGGGIGTTKNAYIFYSIISTAQMNDDPKSIARTEAVYKTVK